jgi:nucleosome-remodeling factor subunit BPTF
MSRSESPESFNNDSDSDFSLSSFSNVGQGGLSQTRSVTPEPVWLKDDIEIPPLELPKTSDDLLVSKQYVLRALGIYEVLRRYRNLVRMSPFRVEDYCAAITCDEQSALLTEIHIALIKAILREEDSQQTHFGPLDQKDSINISLYLLDTITWPEVLRIYVESDPGFSREVLNILSTREYPYSGIEDRLTVLQFLADQFLTTTFVRDDMIQEGPIHYDDHCRVCHRLGNLLCCETCPAVYHLECVDPPLEDVPTEDWQCNICKSHSISGVNDCISSREKQGSLCRQEHLGFDRHARKYWFVCRRLFVETEDGSETWYYSSEAQFEQVVNRLDPEELEKQLCKEIQEYKDEIIKQMQLTETLTNENKGNKKSYLEIENERIAKETKNTETTSDVENGSADENNDQVNGTDQDSSSTPPPSTTVPPEIDKNDQTHLTRSRTNQISSGTFYFKLGMENLHKEYMNQFTTNPLALNKPQKNEERDKKRHLSHKFSLTDASTFKWGGLLNGTEHSLIAVFKQTLMSFESSLCASFMHCNWPKLRKVWLNAVAAATTAQDFLKVLITLQSSMKSVVYANVWHEQLGHIHLYRITSAEREERKKIEKREKREENEEERNRLAYNYVKYSLGLKHQVWKQKGEEYRIHGQWGWIWCSKSRRKRQILNEMRTKRVQCINVVVKKDETQKVISLKRQAFENFDIAIDFAKKYNSDEDENKVKKCDIIKEMIIEDVVDKTFESLDVSEALKTKTRLIYSKVAKKSILDDFLERREKLRDMEMKVPKENETPEIPENVIPTVNAENAKKKPSGSTACVHKMIQDIVDNKSRITQKSKNSDVIEKCLKIHSLQAELSKVLKTLNIHKCFSEKCRNSTEIPSLLASSDKIKCFSALCVKESQLRDKIVSLIQQLRDKFTGTGKKGILHQKLAEAKNNDLLDILNKFHLGDYMTDEYFTYNIDACLEDISNSVEEAIDFDENFITSCCPKIEPKVEDDENSEPKIKDVEVKTEKKEDGVRQPNRRFLAITKPKKEIELEKELDADGKEKIYSVTSTAGKIYLKKPDKIAITATPPVDSNIISKYPAVTTYTTVKNTKSILVLPKFEINRIARRAGKYYTTQFNHQAKNNNSVWPYPCSRPFFRTCWIYRTFCANTFSALGLQLRILWTCLRWDDMQMKPLTLDGKNQVTSETEIVTTELLKHRNVGPFMDLTQYFRRRVVIPLELPKTVREVNPIRSGLRKRKRAESPQQTDPQVNEEWIDEDKLELWEIKQYGEK